MHEKTTIDANAQFPNTLSLEEFYYCQYDTLFYFFIVCGNFNYLVMKSNSLKQILFRTFQLISHPQFLKSSLQPKRKVFNLFVPQRFYLLVYLFVLTLMAINPQVNSQILFQKTFGTSGSESGSCGIQTKDNGYLMLGSTFMVGGPTGADIYAIKTNETGDTVWTRTFGTDLSEFGYTVQQTFDGGYILCGGQQFRMIKLNPTGDTIWTQYLKGVVKYVIESNDSGYVAVGANGVSELGVYIVKFTKNGNKVWSKRYFSNDYMDGKMIQQTNDGGFILTGSCDDVSLTDTNMHIMKLNSSGDFVWSRVFGGAALDDGVAIQQTTDGGYIMLGTTFSYGSGVNNSNIMLLKTNSNGIPIWSKTFGDSSHSEEAIDLVLTNDGGYVIAGLSGEQPSNMLLIKTDSNGNTSWSKTYGGAGNNRLSSVRVTNDGGYLLSGQTNGFGAGGTDIYLIKTDSNGNSPCNVNVANMPGNNASVFASALFISGDSSVNYISSTLNISSAGQANTICVTTPVQDAISLIIPLNISPNPFNDQTQLSFDYKQGMQYRAIIHDIAGRIMKTIDPIRSGMVAIGRDGLNDGIYLLELYQDQQLIGSVKMLLTAP